MDYQTLYHAGITVLGAVATVVALKVDISWIKRWTAEHEQRDTMHFTELSDRIGRVETHLLK